MSWEDRLREAAYTPPNGQAPLVGRRMTFMYEDVSRGVTKRTAAYEFPDVDGTLIQDMGASGRRYPMRIFFTGEDCDEEAEEFEDALLIKGSGQLEHPMYGLKLVVPFGRIGRRDDLKTAANQVILDVTFWETIGEVFPSSQVDSAGAAAALSEAFVDAAEDEFAQSTELVTAVDRVDFRSVYDALYTDAKAQLASIAQTTNEVFKEFREIQRGIDDTLDTFIDGPLGLASQTVRFVQSAARADASILARLAAYRRLIDSIIGEDNTLGFRARDLYATSYVSAAVLSTVNNQFETKPAALTAADTILAMFADVVAWRDQQFVDLGEADTGEAYQTLQAAVAAGTGFLVETSFSLKQERIIHLDRARTLVDLCAEIYGELDDKFDFLITTNDLTGSEILELPRGRAILYYA